MEGIAPLGALDPQHAITQLVKALAHAARAFAFVRHRNGSSASWFSVLAQAPRWHSFGVQEARYGGNSYTSRSRYAGGGISASGYRRQDLRIRRRCR